MRRVPVIAVLVLVAATTARAQTLDDVLDEDAFLRGLSEFRLPGVLDAYSDMRPPTDDIRAASFVMARERMVATDPSAPVAARVAAIDRLLAARRQLIDAHPDNSRLGRWLADQSADLYFLLLPVESSGLFARFGVPTPAQRARAGRAARQMVDLADEADLVIEDTILEIESRPGYDRDITLQLERRRLGEQERDRRLPFLRGVGALLDATLSPEPADREDGWRTAAELLAPLAYRLDGVIRVDATLYAAEALARLGRHDEANELLVAARADPDIDARARLVAQLVEIVNITGRDGIEEANAALDRAAAASAAPDRVLERLLIVDQRALLHVTHAGTSAGAARDQALRRACDTYIDLLEHERALPADLLRSLVMAKIAAIDVGGVPMDDLPAIVTVARAVGLAEGARLDEARALFESALARPDLGPADRAAALTGLAGVDLDADRLDAAADRFATVAAEHPTSTEAPRAIHLAAAIATRQWQDVRDDAGRRERMRRILDLAIERYPTLALIDRWHFDAGRLALAEGRHDAAYAHFDAVGRDAPLWATSRFRMVDLRRDQARAAADPDLARSRWSAVVEAVAAVQPGLIRAAANDNVVASALPRLAVNEAEARFALGDHAAALEALDTMGASIDDPRVAADALRVRILALQAAGRATEAREAIDDFAVLAPGQAVAVLSAMLVSARAPSNDCWTRRAKMTRASWPRPRCCRWRSVSPSSTRRTPHDGGSSRMRSGWPDVVTRRSRSTTSCSGSIRMRSRS